jgi:integrase
MANREITPLTDKKVLNALPREKKYTLPDGNGLQLAIFPDGKKVWEIRYTINGKPKATTAGVYNAKEKEKRVSLAEARAKRDELKSKVSKGIDPIQEKKEIKAIIEANKIETQTAINTQFHKITYEWLSTLNNDDATATKRKRAFERDIFPHFCTYDERHVITSSKAIGDITHGELLKIITAKGKTAPETASRLFADCNRLWIYAVSHEYTDLNITLRIDKSVLPKHEEKHMAKITDKKILGELLRGIDGYYGEGGVIVRNILRFVSLIPLRADNLCKLKWSQIDFEKAVITIPRSEMKVKDKNLPDFKIPLPHQAINVLKEIKEVTGWGVWVFHGVRNNLTHANKESGNKALRALGFNDEVSGRKQTLHSFRGTFASLIRTHHKEHNATFETMEAVLDHQEEKLQVRAYTHKADYTEQMRELLQWWADYLDEVKVVKNG